MSTQTFNFPKSGMKAITADELRERLAVKPPIMTMTASKLQETFDGIHKNELKEVYRGLGLSSTDIVIVEAKRAKVNSNGKGTSDLEDDTSHEERSKDGQFNRFPITLKGTIFQGLKAPECRTDAQLNQYYESKITGNKKKAKSERDAVSKKGAPQRYTMMQFSIKTGLVVDEVLRSLEMHVAVYLREYPEYCTHGEKNRALSNWIVPGNPGYPFFTDYAETACKDIIINELEFYNYTFDIKAGNKKKTPMSLEDLLNFTDGPGSIVDVDEKLKHFAKFKKLWLKNDVKGLLGTIKSRLNQQNPKIMETIENLNCNRNVQGSAGTSKSKPSGKSPKESGSGNIKTSNKSPKGSSSDKGKSSGKPAKSSGSDKGSSSGKSSKKPRDKSPKKSSAKSTKAEDGKKTKAEKAKKDPKTANKPSPQRPLRRSRLSSF